MPQKSHVDLLQKLTSLLILFQMDDIFHQIDDRISDHEKRVARQMFDLEHKFGAKLITMNESLIDIRRAIGSTPRLSKVEDEIRDIKRELQVSETTTSTLSKSY